MENMISPLAPNTLCESVSASGKLVLQEQFFLDWSNF